MKLNKKIFLLLATGDSITNGMDNDLKLNLNNLPYNDMFLYMFIISDSTYERLSTSYEELKNEYQTLKQNEEIMENYLKELREIVDINVTTKKCLNDLKEIVEKIKLENKLQPYEEANEELEECEKKSVVERDTMCSRTRYNI